MHCPQCGVSNPNQARFCFSCGFGLIQGTVCQTCFTLLPSSANFCFHCGAMVIANAAAAPPAGGPVQIQPAHAPAVPVQAAAAHPQAAQPAAPPTTASIGQLPAAREIKGMLPSLKRYLPQTLYDPLERRPNAQQIDQVAEHLTALLKTAKTYLPYPVVATPQPAGEPAGGMYQGVFLFGDVSGFTPLSEQLKVLEDGAERLAEIINALFFDLVSVLFAHGGTLLKFGGDALLGVFPFENEDGKSAQAEKAAQAALAMQAVMENYAAIEVGEETRGLAIKCGISTGPYFAAHIGTHPNPDTGHIGTMAYVTTGHTVNRAEQAEGHANPGDVVMDNATYALISDKVKEQALEGDFHKLLDIPASTETSTKRQIQEPPDGPVEQQITYLVNRLNLLAPYLSPELIHRIVNNPGDPRISPDNRTVTVMFVNYLGISDLIEDLGGTNPDMITKHLNAYFNHMAGVVEHYEGTLARMDQYAVGDRLVIFFGAPRAHEDDPARAVFAALDMQAALRKHFAALQTPTGIYRFRQRIGINTGRLFAGNAGAPDLRQEYTLMGDDINMAARLMSNAGWQETLISRSTMERLGTEFRVKDRGELKVKGKEILIPTFEVLARAGADDSEATFKTRMIGRDEDLQLLLEHTQALGLGRSQIMTLIGESGLGKSRLAHALRASAEDDDSLENVLWLEGRCHSFTEQVSYWLAAQIIRGTLALADEENEDDLLFNLWDQGEKLLSKETAREAIPFIAYLLGLRLEGEWQSWVEEMDPKSRQKQIGWSVSEYLKALAASRSIFIKLEDLQFADEASLILIEQLFDLTLQVPIVFLLIFRPQREKRSWQVRGTAANSYHHHYTEINLYPFSREQGQELLGELLPGAKFPANMLATIYNKTGGNPFYIEEVVRSLTNTGAVIPSQHGEGLWEIAEHVDTLTVPDTLQEAIIARIDRLTEDARKALQTAAVIGRSFEIDILKAIISSRSELGNWLGQLERNDLISPERSARQAYSFVNAMIHEVAYDNLLTQNRQEIHKRVAQLLVDSLTKQAALQEDGEVTLADLLAKESEILAYHFYLAKDYEHAAKYLEMAGNKTRSYYAYGTAITYFEQLLEIRRAQEDQGGTASVLYTLGVMAYEIGEYNKAETYLKEAVAIFGDLADLANVGWSTMYQGMIALKRGQYGLAIDYHQQALNLAQEREDEFQAGVHLTNLARVYMRTGQYEKAQSTFVHSFEKKKKTQDIKGQGFAHFYVGLIHIFKDELDDAENELQKGLTLWRETVQDKRGEGYSLFGLGMHAYAKQDYDTAEDYLNQAYTIYDQLALNAEIIECLSLMSQVYLAQGSLEKALETSNQTMYKLQTQRDVEEVQGIYYNHYKVLHAVDKDDEAQTYLDKAHQIVLEQKDNIPAKADQTTFEENVPVNRQILAAFENE